MHKCTCMHTHSIMGVLMQIMTTVETGYYDGAACLNHDLHRGRPSCTWRTKSQAYDLRLIVQSLLHQSKRKLTRTLGEEDETMTQIEIP